MLVRIFPRQIDNAYRGHRLGIGLLALFVAIKLIMSTNSILNTRSVAAGADGIPLESYAAGGAETVIRLFSLLALSQLVLALLGVIALVRYRAMIPLVYLLLLAEHLGRRAIGMIHPAEGPAGASAGLYINLALLAVLILGLGLSLLPRARAADGVVGRD